MTITYGDVRQWDSGALDTVADTLRGRQRKLVDLQDELDDAGRLPTWHGEAGATARSSLKATRNRAEILVAELSAVEQALRNAADETIGVRNRVADNDALAATHQFHIGADGTIRDGKAADPAPRSRFEAEEMAEAARYRETIRQQLVQETTAILTAAVTVDTTLARVMRMAQDGHVSDLDAENLADAGKNGAIEAKIADMEQALIDAGLLNAAPTTLYYRQWLENAVRRGVPIETMLTIAAENDITPDDFRIFNQMVEFREDVEKDGTDKFFFLLPEGISGDDAAKAVRMTYLLNAGTDYGANGQQTDFTPTPYGSEEYRRIVERQKDNSWSYDEDVGFVHLNGGRLVTTPNGVMMGVGGNWLQDRFSLQGGTMYGDTFMMNLDSVDDPADQLQKVVASGRHWYEGPDGPYAGSLDLDRLLHHEERHSQQWAREGYTKFIASYGWEQLTGGTQTEEDAGLSDGGYH
ncbi:hypothetical protein [Actinoplanes couchii]|uniref:WXG100 family type VII secretion target n=1 Tax=Actinoplanes couchii TaxID=403638 RepID=A0ABQ3XU67_9ACTN|nr:hypothetical protein [Actinoplanes couchii]MDR6319982.1 hypothetical protein [Actinoplanes couchii]GID62064.1 hypothetical protein Aco03nite_104680 [Actinoplanes couchii]